MQLIVDTREQYPLFKDEEVMRRKLDEGDYSIIELEDKLVVERKSPVDLYGSIIQGHRRFTDELIRAKLKGKKIYVFVECLHEDFILKIWDTRYPRLKTPPSTLAKIIKTMEIKYEVIFVWCRDRNEMEIKIKELFKTFYLLTYNKELN